MNPTRRPLRKSCETARSNRVTALGVCLRFSCHFWRRQAQILSDPFTNTPTPTTAAKHTRSIAAVICLRLVIGSRHFGAPCCPSKLARSAYQLRSMAPICGALKCPNLSRHIEISPVVCTGWDAWTNRAMRSRRPGSAGCNEGPSLQRFAEGDSSGVRRKR